MNPGQPTHATPVDLSDHRRSVRGRLRRALTTMRRLDLDWLAEKAAERLLLRHERRELLRARAGRDVCWTTHDADPLVTVRIATAGRPELLIDRALRTALDQTYPNVEVVVVADGPLPETAAAVARLDDPRIRYVELGRHTPYPAREQDRWLVAGYEPMNTAIALARGDWIAPCDDDDELTRDHVEVLLRAAQEGRHELVYSKTAIATGPDSWALLGHPRLKQGHLTHGSVLYSAGLRFMRYSGRSHLLDEPFDWNMWRRMRSAGVRIGFVDAVTYRYYPSPVTAEGFRLRAEERS